MPKKKNLESQEKQSERFNKAVADLIAAGELNPTDAEAAMERVLAGEKAKLDRKED